MGATQWSGFLERVILSFGIYQIFDLTWPSKAGSVVLALISVTAVFLLPSLVSRHLRPLAFLKLGIRYRPHVITVESKHLVDVSAHGNATVSVERTYLFLRKHLTEDLYDVCESSPGMRLSDIQYESEDAEEVSRRLYRRFLAILWRPNTTLTPLVPYRHTFSWKPKANLAETANYWTFVTDLQTGTHEIQIHTEREVRNAVAFLRPRLQRLRRDEDVYRCARTLSKPCCPQPTFTTHTIEWQLVNPPVGRKYFIVWFHNDGLSLSAVPASAE